MLIGFHLLFLTVALYFLYLLKIKNAKNADVLCQNLTYKK